MRFLLTLLVPVLLFMLGCNRKPPKAAVPPLPVVKIEEIPAPHATTVKIERGSNLRAVAGAAYGHEDFSGFVAALNGIADPTRVAAGATLKTPALAVGLRDAGLDPAYQPAVNVLARVWDTLRTALREYERERDAVSAPDSGSFAISAPLSRKLLQCANDIDAALDVLAHPKAGHKVPRSTLGKFAGVSGMLRSFAAGQVGSRDYDVFMAGKDFGLGFTYALIWAQSQHQ